jgi:hypothetical protein
MRAQSRQLTAFITAGLFFMLVPGTLMGVLNLISAAGHHSIGRVSPAWLQAHGHAQIFGWIGSFIMGIGLYATAGRAPGSRATLARGWIAGVLWVSGVLMRWTVAAYGDPTAVIAPFAPAWRPMLAASGLLELGGAIIFMSVVARHRPAPESHGERFPLWVRMVATASAGLLTTLIMNAALCVWFARYGTSPAIPHEINQRFLVVSTWGFLAPFVWGFSAHWLPVFLGLPAVRSSLVLPGLAANCVGVVAALSGQLEAAVWLLLVGAMTMSAAIGIFRRSVHPPKTRGIHPSFPFFVRAAYVWLIVAALLGVAAFRWDTSGGLWGASRHAFTVGFITTMVFSIGQRVLPQFAAQRELWSARLMLIGLVLLMAGCTIRVTAEIAAYQRDINWAWRVLPASAVLELIAVCAFAVNIGMSIGTEASGARA